MKNGVNQSGRLLPALEPSYIVPDERSLLDLVQFTLDYSDAVSYFDLQNRRLGTWRPFLLDDPVFVAGLIAATSFDSHKARQEDLAVKAENKSQPKREIQEAMAVNLLDMIKHLLKWEGLFHDANYSGPLAKEVTNSRKFLEPLVQRVFPYQTQFGALQFSGISISPDTTAQEVNFNECFKTAYKNLVYIVELAGRRFDELINEQSGNHQPHIGLLLAALKLFTEVQTDMNLLTRRHLDFYYQRILQQEPCPAGMLQILIGLLPKPGAEVLMPQSEFVLLFSSKKTISLQNQFHCELTQARIVELRSLYKSTYYPFSSGLDGESHALNGIYDTILYEGEGSSELVFKGDSNLDYPLIMGEDQSQKGLNQRTMEASLLGLLLSSPVLLVESGKHYFQLTLELSPASCAEFTALLTGLFSEKEKAMGGAYTYSQQGLRSFIQSFLNEAFVVSVTAAKGWKTLDYAHFSFMESDCKLIVKLEPEGQDELPIAFDAQLHGGVSDTTWPSVRFLLNNSAHYPPYKALQVLEIMEVEILTLTKGVSTGYSCSNQLGKLDVSNPFLPFGSLPTKDSYLRIFSPLIFNKYLRRLSLRLTWLGYPEGRTGFVGHYSGYSDNIDNSSFQAIIAVRSLVEEGADSQRMPEQKVRLFDTKEKSDGEYLEKNKVVDLNLDLVDRSILKEPRPSSPGQQGSSYLVVQLSDPSPFAFGHDKYAQLYADASFHNSKYPKRQRELPRPAYTPLLEKIEFSYSNYAKENLARKGSESDGSIKLFHLYPFGHSQVFPVSGNGSSYLVPQLTGRGNLLIGLTNVTESEIINLGFKLYPAIFIHTITHPPAISWEYLEKNTWNPLGNLLMEDSTHGMLQSGIVKIKLPSRLDFDNTRLGPGKFWIRISNVGATDINSRLIALFTNAAWVTQVPSSSGDVLPEELRHSLTVATVGNPELNAVSGPYHIKVSSFRKSAEGDRARVSELLRHRGRGGSTWDLERLVLERFVQIGRVMVYGRSDFPLHLVKGSNVQVVVIPRSPLSDDLKGAGFRAPLELLQEIKSFLQDFVSPLTRLEVCNPVFEKLKIRGAVKFRQTQLSGYYRDQLERELIEFLSPNPGDFQNEKGFINSIYKTEIQSFIESRSYVDFVTGLSVLQIVEVQGSYKIIDTADSRYNVELLRTISPYAILTSAENHQLEIIQDHILLDPEIASIGDLSIDSDFIVGQSKI